MLSGALACASTFVLLATSAQPSSAASPNDYLCAVGSAVQTATVSSGFANPLEVEISTTPCSAPTPDTSAVNVTFAIVGTPSASASFDTGAITSTSGFVSVSATANDEAGSYSVIATSPATANSSSPSATFSLTNSDLLFDSMTADVASYQSTDVSTAFALALAVTIDDAKGNPVPSVPVIFVAPTSGASGTFAGGSTSSYVDTDAQGVAVAPTFYANDTPGGYAVEAESSGYASAVAFAMSNDALSATTVSSVTPTVLSQGAAQVVTISGSGFQSDAQVIFSSPGIKVGSTTFVSPQELKADVTISASARVGASNVTVSDPAGSSATGEEVFTVSPLVAVAPEPLELGFSHNATRLSGVQVRTLRRFARDLSSRMSVECVGYGTTSELASERALQAARFIRSVDPRARISQRSVVSLTADRVEVEVR
jgi:hypothetical protein